MARVRAPAGRGAKLRKTWFGFSAIHGSNLTAAQTVLGSISFANLATEATHLRTRGEILIAAVPDAATDIEVIGLGLCVVTNAAKDVGGVSVPGPINDIESDVWLWHSLTGMDAVVLTGADANARSVVHRVTIDAKAMRRVPDGHALILVGERSQTAFAGVAVTGMARSLFGH